jgi:serine/threonine-protein phosphatase 2A regulatory subunit B''
MTTDKVNSMLNFDDVVIGHASLLPSSNSGPRGGYKGSVLPLEDNPELAELLLESTDYLINPIGEMTSMKRPASAQSSASSSSQEKAPGGGGGGGVAAGHDDDDIAAIAKQISDHAEAIYQTWKSRGLGPAELRNICQPAGAAAAQTFAPVLTPTSPKAFPGSPSADPKAPPSFKTPSVGMLNPSQLEYLVSSFVEEDKARMVANNSKMPAVSLIQSQVKKFDQAATSGRNSPLLHKVAPPAAKKSVFEPSGMMENGLTTWPLKNHLGPRTHKVDVAAASAGPALVTHLGTPTHKIEPIQVIHYTEALPISPSESSPGASKYATLPSKKKNTAAYLEEVAREEERLINALKTGCVIENLEHKMVQSPSFESPKGRTSPKPSEDKFSGLSRIDYAKIRYQNAQENPLTRQRMANNRELDPMLQLNNQHAAVLEARTRFESQTNGEHVYKLSDWTPSKPDGAPLPAVASVPMGRSRIKMGRKSRGDLDAVPHPELTVQQKQHIRDRGTAAAMSASAAGPAALGTNPIRPFLTRGSVAERVLIFEKCPPSEVLNPLMEKRKAPPVITTWRSGNEVQNKTQVSSTANVLFVFVLD